MVFMQMTVSGAALILFTALLRKAGKSLPKYIFPVLWGIVLARLLLPIAVPSAYSIYSLPILKEAVARVQSYETAQGPEGADAAESADAQIPVNAPKPVNGQAGTGTAGTETAGMGNDWVENAGTKNTWAENAGIGDVWTGNAGSGDVWTENARTGSAWGQTGAEMLNPEGTEQENTGWPGFRKDIFIAVWCAGMLACMIFFTVAYLHALFRFRTSLPVEEAFVGQWLREHRLRRTLSVRLSGRVTTPLTYGIFRPVILLPKKTDWKNKEALSYILLHEYVHIRRMDAAMKLLAALTLCIHWFNPFVWMMYILLNRDLELACDEKVVRISGKTQRAVYARMLIDMAAGQSGPDPLGSYFGRNAVEERIDAIMKWKKVSLYKKLMAGVICAVAAVACAGSMLTIKVNAGKEDPRTDKSLADEKVSSRTEKGPADGNARAEELSGEEKNMPSALGFTEEEYTKLLALRGYEAMTVAAYQEKEPEPWEKEPRINGYAVKEDYDSLLSLRTEDYQQMTVAGFNQTLLDWGNANYGAYERIREDVYRKDSRVDLSEEELFFVNTTMTLSTEENYRMIQSLKTGRPEEAPLYCSYRLQKTKADGLAWCGFDYAFSWQISDKDAVTVAERDAQVGGVIRDIENFWEETDLEEYLQMTKEDVLERLNEIADGYSDGRIKFSIDAERVYFEEMDERALALG